MSDFENLNLKQIRDLGDKIGSEARAKRFQSGELVLVERTDPRAVAMILNFERKVGVASRRFITGESFTKSNPKVKFGYIDERITKLFPEQEDVLGDEFALHTLLQNAH